MPLTNTQLQALCVLDWLFNQNEHRATGRTHVIAIALVRIALQHPGQRVHYLDHNNSPQRRRQHIQEVIEELVATDPILATFEWDWQQDHFRLRTPGVTDVIPFDWLPVSRPFPTHCREMLTREDAIGTPVRWRTSDPERKSVWDRLKDDEILCDTAQVGVGPTQRR